MSLTLDNVVSVTVLTAAIPPAKAGFGAALFLGRATILPLEARELITAQQSDITDAGFATTSEEYLAGGVYFGQSPKPKGPFKIGRQFLVAQAGKLLGGSASAVVATYTGVSNGGFDILVNGVNRQIFALDFSAQTTMAGVAGIIQTKLNAALAGTTCTWSGSAFVITSPTTGSTSLVGFGGAPTGGSSPVDVSSLLFLTALAGSRKVNGIAIESITDALVATRALDSGWYGLAIPQQASAQDNKDAMAFCQTNKVKFWSFINDANAYDPAATSDLGYFAKSSGYDHTFVMYSSAPYASVSAEAREQVTDIDQPNSFGTLKFKQLPGIPVDNLTSGQVAALKAKNINYYTSFGGFNMLAEGIMANGQFSDEVFGLDAFSVEYQNAIFTALATPATKVPQTNKGGTQLLAEGAKACEKFVRNGFFAPGVWEGNTIDGVVEKGEFLKLGYKQVIGAVEDQSLADRASRKTPPITVVGKGAGAFHSAAVTFIFDR